MLELMTFACSHETASQAADGAARQMQHWLDTHEIGASQLVWWETCTSVAPDGIYLIHNFIITVLVSRMVPTVAERQAYETIRNAA